LLNKRKNLVVILILVVIIVTAIIFNQPKNQRQEIHFEEIEEVISLIQDGDIIFRMGDRIWSQSFRDLSPTERRFSHLGIVRKRDDVITVINSEAMQEYDDVVTEVTLERFLQPALCVGLFRMHDLDGELISDTAMEFIGIPFDWKFDMEDSSKLYCTELLYVVLKKIYPSIKLNTTYIKELGKNIILLDICLQTEYFTEIGYWITR